LFTLAALTMLEISEVLTFSQGAVTLGEGKRREDERNGEELGEERMGEEMMKRRGGEGRKERMGEERRRGWERIAEDMRVEEERRAEIV
jgi:hypothetical protein